MIRRCVQHAVRSAPEGYVDDATDCDDGDESVNPDAIETCNETDDDCDGSVDEEVFDATTYSSTATATATNRWFDCGCVLTPRWVCR